MVSQAPPWLFMAFRRKHRAYKEFVESKEGVVSLQGEQKRFTYMQLTEQCRGNHDGHLAYNDAHMQLNHVSQIYRVFVCIVIPRMLIEN